MSNKPVNGRQYCSRRSSIKIEGSALTPSKLCHVHRELS